MADPPAPQFSINGTYLINLLIALLPVATGVLTFLRKDGSYEVVFFALLLSGVLYQMRKMVVDLREEKAAHAATQDECHERDIKWQADLEMLRHDYDTKIQILQTSLFNAVNDLRDAADAPPEDRRRLIGRFRYDPAIGISIYESARRDTQPGRPGAPPIPEPRL